MPPISQLNIQNPFIGDNGTAETEDISPKDNTSVVVAAFTEYRQRLLKLAAKILGCQHSAEDVVQDAYIKMLQASATFEIKYPISYLYQVVRNLAIDRFRRTAFELRNFTNEADGLQIPEPAQVPETIIIDRQHVRIVAHALSELPERTQTAFSLYSVDGYTQREIAKKLNVSPTLVNFMIRDAQSHCRNAMSDRY
jgi:RNA polymerase sigma factor (sigma-70 family)